MNTKNEQLQGFNSELLIERTVGLLTKEGVRERLRLDLDDLDKEIREGRLPVTTEFGTEMIARKDVESWLKNYDKSFERRTVSKDAVLEKLKAYRYLPKHLIERYRYSSIAMYRASELEPVWKEAEEYQNISAEIHKVVSDFAEKLFAIHEKYSDGDKIKYPVENAFEKAVLEKKADVRSLLEMLIEGNTNALYKLYEQRVAAERASAAQPLTCG